MAATVELPTGATGLGSGVTVDVFPDGSDTADVTGAACVESTNRKGVYTFTATALTGLKYLSLKNDGHVFGYGWAYLSPNGVVQMEESRSAALMQGDGAPVKSNTKKNQALNSFVFMMTDSTNHAPTTGKTVTVTRSLDGGVFGAGAISSVSEIGNGLYAVNLAASDMNANCVVVRATATGCDDTIERLITEP
jgi:hypothetical protein